MLHYQTHVLGPDHDWVVFLHGLGGNSNIWYKQVKEFKTHFNLLFIDLKGHGGSVDHRPELLEYTAEVLTEDVVKVLDFLSIEKAHFAGISLGSVILHGMHIYAPHRIKSMILGGAIIRFTRFARVLLKTGDLIKGLVPYMWLYKLFAWILMPKKHHQQSRNLFIKEAKKLRRKEFIRWYKFASTVPVIYPQIDTEKYLIPKTYIMGDQDYMFIGPVREDTVNDKAATVHVIEKCGHVCNIEKYKEFNRVAINFFKERVQEEKKEVPVPKPIRRLATIG
ncbi:alpha/beta fold hydrolase [Sporosarcina sp. G11-34]|uniref:alpha/beta fold hydrolase n=1 Tax=Sporosarcina sp. G11-34 TaxID=2849605 RepID=UPI0022A92AE9|nr:alpha/beta hydrolase [Sporosarcina sp. G11-34]MCZ2257367.1 alpha/beta hydrolase [Sporosarcina sp. G11-34]